MLNQAIKKLIFILLLFVTLYLGILVLPSIVKVGKILFDMFLPFLIAFVFAFILQPIVSFLQRHVKRRGIAVLIVIVVFFGFIALLIWSTVPELVQDMKTLETKIPEIMEELENFFNRLFKSFSFLPEDYQPTFDRLTEYVDQYIQKISIASNTFFSKIFHFLSFIVIVPIILIYFLLDYEKIICKFRDFLIKHHKIRFKNYLADLNQTMSSYFRGVLLVMIILVILFTTAFSLIGLEYALFFSIIIAITNIIPYLGAYIGAFLPVLYALLDSPKKAITVVIISILFQTLESDVITPYVQGKQMKLHPLVVMISLVVFGGLFGIFGMMIAVPVVSFLKITLHHYPIRFLKESKQSLHNSSQNDI